MTRDPDVFGVWLLRTYYLEDVETGKRIEPFGPKPKGVFILLPGGRAMAVLTPAEQRRPVTEAEQASAWQSLIAYSGHFRVEPPNRLVTTVDVAWFQPWVGSEQARLFTVHGEMLEITSEPTHTPITGDALVVGKLLWVRENAA